ncbi:hypothetical protein GCM10007415_06820 [Parapedobacter pyrenivorans]|uniref:CBM6 domain-containing protein n=1 Tax=Parapedobacter pyrenivorans TaxID=1305674 RepID=A0A917HFG5_9SPHI|nr:Ig-like domain-containing protein [Parapedobacter pyrenivorans]GGG77516.1 hypothetical protein GCM10007415_06820 [Parapedobacter pyrenivorans]
MKNKFNYLALGILLSLCTMGCDDYEVKDIPKNIYVDKASLSLFVGEQMQLKVSPTDGTYNYQWTSEDPAIATVSSSGLVQAISSGFTNVIVTGGPAKTLVPITSITRIPLEDVILSENNIELMPGGQKTLLATFIPATANDIPDWQWVSENPEIATVSENGEITAIGEGITHIVYRAGTVEQRAVVDVSFTSPFNGPHILSAAAERIIYAADFDYGGEGLAFHDADATSAIGNDNYRRGKGDTESFAVEIEGDGNNIGYINGGEWWQYTVYVQDAGEYWFDLGLSAAGDAKLRVEVDGVNVTGTVDVPNNGSWADWRWFPDPRLVINFTAGKHKVRIFTEQSGFNLRGMRFFKK